jgi:hypothetical protein
MGHFFPKKVLCMSPKFATKGKRCSQMVVNSKGVQEHMVGVFFLKR